MLIYALNSSFYIKEMSIPIDCALRHQKEEKAFIDK